MRQFLESDQRFPKTSKCRASDTRLHAGALRDGPTHAWRSRPCPEDHSLTPHPLRSYGTESARELRRRALCRSLNTRSYAPPNERPTTPKDPRLHTNGWQTRAQEGYAAYDRWLREDIDRMRLALQEDEYYALTKEIERKHKEAK